MSDAELVAPRVVRKGIEDTALLWGNAAWSLTVLWSDSVLWSDTIPEAD